jgi:TonB family protein
MRRLTAAPSGFALAGELATIRRRTRRGVAASLGAHVVLLLLLRLTASDSAPVEGLVEITWIEAPAAVPAPPPAPARVTRSSSEGATEPERPAPRPVEDHFVREMPRAETAPEPQREPTSRDALRSKLAALTRDASESRTQIAALLPRTDSARPALASAPAEPEASPASRSLVRGEPKRSVPDPAKLVRAAAVPAPSMAALARLVDEPVARAPEPTASAASFPPREVLAGVTLAGPVSDRALIDWRLPSYPEWAKREAVEGSVRLRFVVRPDGGVKEDVMVERTSGYEDFDRNATLALLDWRFEPVPGADGEQWGSITLDYRLDAAR